LVFSLDMAAEWIAPVSFGALCFFFDDIAMLCCEIILEAGYDFVCIGGASNSLGGGGKLVRGKRRIERIITKGPWRDDFELYDFRISG